MVDGVAFVDDPLGDVIVFGLLDVNPGKSLDSRGVLRVREPRYSSHVRGIAGWKTAWASSSIGPSIDSLDFTSRPRGRRFARNTLGGRVGTLGEPALFQGVEISPDGKRVAAVTSDGVTARSVWIYDVERGIRTRFGSVNNAKYLGMTWSPDSRRLAIALQRDGAYAVYAKVIGESREHLLFSLQL